MTSSIIPGGRSSSAKPTAMALQTIGGIELLIHQAMLAFQRWTGAEFDPADHEA